jgi:hypothetical protein
MPAGIAPIVATTMAAINRWRRSSGDIRWRMAVSPAWRRDPPSGMKTPAWARLFPLADRAEAKCSKPPATAVAVDADAENQLPSGGGTGSEGATAVAASDVRARHLV